MISLTADFIPPWRGGWWSKKRVLEDAPVVELAPVPPPEEVTPQALAKAEQEWISAVIAGGEAATMRAARERYETMARMVS